MALGPRVYVGLGAGAPVPSVDWVGGMTFNVVLAAQLSLFSKPGSPAFLADL